ncbi:MAG TPA: cation:proton antiporter [Gemmatimonadaceae bacterium]|nr:cation:proton antiporter [Gemmatimonadaceae bacterium]
MTLSTTEQFVSTIALIGIVIIVASLLSGVLERTAVPLVAVFLTLGATLGPSGLGVLDVGLQSPSLRVLAILGLTLVLFSDAVTLDTNEIRSQRALALRVLGPGTLLPAALIALLGWALLDVGIAGAAILGASLASTDPVLLRSVLRSRAIPPAPRMALRLESGMNDAVLLPVVVLAMLFMQAGPARIDGASLRHHLVGLFVLGPVLGALVGWLGIIILGQVRDRVGVRRDYESIYALGLAFTAYAVAESVGGSGFLAAFFAGLLVAMQDVELCDCFLEYGEATAEMLLLLTFVALGTSLIWTGLSVISVRTVAFAIIALLVRTVILYPMLTGTGLTTRDRKIIALFGPRGLSSLLFVLLPVFAGVPGAEQLFTITCLVVLLSVVVHGGGIALFMRRSGAPSSLGVTRDVSGASTIAPSNRELTVLNAESEAPDERITLDEVRAAQSGGDEVIMVDSRAEKSYRADARRAAGAVRLSPDDPVRDANALRLSKHATLVVYCA